MRSASPILKELPSRAESDPREGQTAQVIDLATRNVLPTVTQRKRADGLGMAAGVGIVALLGVVTLWSMDAARNGPVNASAQAPVAPAPPASVAPGATAVPAPAAPPAAAPAAPAPSPVLAAPPQSMVAAAPASNPHATPAIVFDASGLPVGIAAPVAAGEAKEGGSGNANEDFAARLGGVGGSKATASASFDPRTTVTQGTLIPAVLETAIDTDVPGFVRAVVSTDVRSFDGARVLIPRSSRLIGQYKSGVQAGQKRAYVIWTRLIRPDGVSVNIGSPGIGFGGETGLAGKVSSHFFERFGSAMLLSVVGGLTALGGNASVVVAGGGQSAAAAAVGQTGQISPTIRVRMGEPVRVFTAKDLDFSKVS